MIGDFSTKQRIAATLRSAAESAESPRVFPETTDVKRAQLAALRDKHRVSEWSESALWQDELYNWAGLSA